VPRPIDPSGFSLEVRLRVIDTGDVYPLWVGGGAPVGGGTSMFFSMAGHFDDIPVVEGATIDIALGINSDITIPISAGFDLGLALLDSQLFQIGNRLEVRIQYPKIGLSTPWFSGLTQRPDFEIGEEGFGGTLKAVGAGYAGQRSSGRDQWENASYADVLSDISDRPYNGWQLVLPDEDGGADDPLYVSRPSVSQHLMSDWVFINHLARLSGCDVRLIWAQDGVPTLEVLRRSDEFAAEPRYTFRFRGQIDNISVFPIYTFSAEGEEVSLPRGNAQVVCSDIDPGSLSIVGAEVTQDQRQEVVPRMGAEAVEPGGAATTADQAVSAVLPAEGEHLVVPAADQGQNQRDAVNRRADEAAARGGFHATLTTMGMHDLLPGEVIRIDGIGSLFSGNYLVIGVTHEVSDGWDTTLKLLSNAQGGEGAIVEVLRRQWSGFNDRQPPERGDPDSGADVDVGSEPAA